MPNELNSCSRLEGQQHCRRYWVREEDSQAGRVQNVVWLALQVPVTSPRLVQMPRFELSLVDNSCSRTYLLGSYTSFTKEYP
jgi:hypothetical protein